MNGATIPGGMGGFGGGVNYNGPPGMDMGGGPAGAGYKML